MKAAYAGLVLEKTAFSFSSDPFSPDELSLLNQFAGIRDRILLLGGGGVADVARWRRFGASRLVLFDLSLEMLRLSPDGIPRIAGNVTRLPFKKKSFDLVYWGSALYNHLPGKKLRWAALLAGKQLSRSGRLIVMCNPLPGGPGFLGRFENLQPLRVAKQWLGGNFTAREPGDARLKDGSFFHYFQSNGEIEEEFEAAGLNVDGQAGGMWVLS